MLNQRQFSPEDDAERNFEVRHGMFHVGGRPFPVAQVHEGPLRVNGSIQHIRIPLESGWQINAHLLNDPEGNPRGQSGHVLGETTIMHMPTFKAVQGGNGMGYVFHEFPEDEPNTQTNTYGRRVLKNVDTPEDFHHLVRYASQLPGSSKPRWED